MDATRTPTGYAPNALSSVTHPRNSGTTLSAAASAAHWRRHAALRNSAFALHLLRHHEGRRRGFGVLRRLERHRVHGHPACEQWAHASGAARTFRDVPGLARGAGKTFVRCRDATRPGDSA